MPDSIATDRAPQPVGPYSQAVRSDGFVFCSMQIGLDPATGSLAEGTIGDETRRVMDNLAAVLAAAGTSLSKTVKSTIYITDMERFGEVNEAYGSYFGEKAPARSTIEVSALPKGARVAVDCIAAV